MENVYKQIKLTGSSQDGVESAVANALERASETIKHMRWFKVVETRGHIVEGKVEHWQVTIEVGFTLEG